MLTAVGAIVITTLIVSAIFMFSISIASLFR